jgi:hypothetical protein
MEQKTTSEMTIDYDVVNEFAGHQGNKKVPMAEAVQDIFSKVKEKGMQCAADGRYIVFTTIDELQRKLEESVKKGFSIKVVDENLGG